MRRKNTTSQIFDRIENKSVVIEVVAQIEDLILSGVLREDDMLPGERALAEQFGVSRPKVREALSLLGQSELVRIVANDGVYIGKLGGEVMSPAMIELFNRSASAIRDNLEYRCENEGFAARLAATRATDQDRAELVRILESLNEADKAKDIIRGSELDLEFHQSIAFAAHNRTLTHMMTALYNLNRSSLFLNRAELFKIGNEAETLQQQHEDIVDSICRGKPALAEKAAQTHINYVATLMETVFEQQSRESVSNKRYRQTRG